MPSAECRVPNAEHEVHQYDDGLATDEKRVFNLQQESAEIQVALERKRSEVSNLVVGYRRAVEGIGPIPADPLKHNLIQARLYLTALEAHLRELQTLEAASPSKPPKRPSADILS